MEVIILAGGFGTRLRSIISNVPKPMAPINDKPFLWYIMEWLYKQNIKKVILCVSYKSEVIKDYFGDKYKEMEIVYSIEEVPLDTGGAIKKAFEKVNSEYIFIVNGDTFFDISIWKMFDHHLKTQSCMTIALKPMKDCDRYGTVVLSNDRIVSFKEKEYKKHGNINGGIYITHRNLFNEFEMQKKFLFENDFIIKHIASLKLMGFIADEYFIDIGIPQDYKRAQIELPKYWGNK